MTTLAPVESPLDALARIAPIIREYADESERQATLATPIVDALREAGLSGGWSQRSWGAAKSTH